MKMPEIVTRTWSRIAEGARNPTSLITAGVLGGFIIGSAVYNYHRYGAQGIVWAILFTAAITLLALHQNAKPEDWRGRDE